MRSKTCHSTFHIPHSKKSALRESNSLNQRGKLAPKPIGQEHKVSTAGFEPAISGSQNRRNTKLSYMLINRI